jgi:COP9 signalosome complex subunit 3
MDNIISQIHTLSTTNDTDLKKLKDFLRHEQESLKANAHQIEQALQMLDLTQNTLGIAFLLMAQLNAGATGANRRSTLAYISGFLKQADPQQVMKAVVPINLVCKSYAQMSIEDGQQAMLRCILPLRCALEKLRPNPETLTPVHAEYLRVCLKAKAYHLAAPVLDQPIFDISLKSNSNYTQMTPQSFLSYFYYGALIRIGMKDFASAMQLLLVVLTCPSSCLSAIQTDAYKKFVLLSLRVHGELQSLPVYCSHIVQRYAKIRPSYFMDIVEAYKQGDPAALSRVVEEKTAQIQADNNSGLVKQVVSSLRRHKVKMLTKTYLTLSLSEIAREIGIDETSTREVEELLFDMISSGEINARIDQSTSNVAFEDDQTESDVGPGMVDRLQGKMQQILELAARIGAFEQEVVSSEAYIRKTAAIEGDRSGAMPALGGYDFMDM